MNVNTLLDRLAADIASLDLSAENEVIDRLQASIVETQAALAMANSRRDELTQLLHPSRASIGGPAGQDLTGSRAKIADCLLRGVALPDIADAVPDVAAMERERELLRSGAIELNQRIEAAERAIETTREQAKAKLAEIAAPVAECVMAEARAAGQVILHAHGAMAAIASATGAGYYDSFKLRDAITTGMMSGTTAALLPVQREVPVPAAVVNALSGVAKLGSAVRAGALTKAHVM